MKKEDEKPSTVGTDEKAFQSRGFLLLFVLTLKISYRKKGQSFRQRPVEREKEYTGKIVRS